MTHDDAALSASLIEQALRPPTRLAPLSALAAELRRPGVWVALCRAAAQRQPEWLEERLTASDPLLMLLASEGNHPRVDAARARAVCVLALAHCGRRPEGVALATAAEALEEPRPAADFASLDATTNPLLSDLLAEVRAPRRVRSAGRVRTVVADARGSATLGSAVVVVVQDRLPGLRDDIVMGLFADQGVTRRLAGVMSAAPSTAQLARVEDDDGWPARGDACQAAVLAASWSAAGGPTAGERLVVGAIGDAASARLGLGEAPPWAATVALLRQDSRRRQAPLVPAALAGQRSELVTTAAGLRRALGRPRRRRRAIALAAAGVVIGGVSVLLLGGSAGDDATADRIAVRAESLLASDPGAAALGAARALSMRRDDATVHAALAVSAQGRLTLAAGQERGRLLALGIDDAGTVTTVSSAGRATRWSLRGGQFVPVQATRISREANVIALSRSGRWLLTSSEQLDSGLVIDTTARVGSRRSIVPYQGSYSGGDNSHKIAAVGDGARPVLATVDPKLGLVLDDGRTRRRVAVPGRVSALGFSPDGTRLAVGLASGHELVLDARSGMEVRAPQSDFGPGDLAPGAITHVDLDDRGTTISQLYAPLAGSPYGPAWRWRSPAGAHALRSVRAPSDHPVVLGGRGLVLVSFNGTIEVRDEHRAGERAAVAQRLQIPVDPLIARPLVASPAAGLAVVASPAGRFSVLDLRRIVEPDRDVVPSSIAVRGTSLRAVGLTSSSAAWLARWSLRSANGPDAAARVRMGASLAGTSLDGRRVILSARGPRVVVLDTTTGRVLDELTIPGRPHWGPVALDAHGDVAAAFDRDDGRVTVWRLPSRGAARALLRSDPTPRTHPGPPEPLALAPKGDYLVHGNATRLLLTAVATGRSRRLPTPGGAQVIRARFADDDRLALGGAGGAIVLSGAGWRSVAKLTAASTDDAVPVHDGVLTASVDGVELRTPTGPDVLVSDGEAADGTQPGTIDAAGESASIVPQYGTMPLAVLRIPSADVVRLCQLAGRRPARRGCSPRPSLPRLDSAPAAGRLSPRAVLAADGLGPVRLGSPLPATLAAIPGYAAGRCEVRALPGLAAAIVTRAGRVESIELFSAPYAPGNAPFHPDVQMMTDIGLYPADYPYTGGVDAYGPPDLRRGNRNVWRLRTRGRSVSTLSMATSPGGPSITLADQEARCVVWR